nr:MAG TPA: hypothetical protein [Microviridae sp.]
MFVFIKKCINMYKGVLKFIRAYARRLTNTPNILHVRFYKEMH